MRPLIFVAFFSAAAFAQAPMQPQKPDEPAAQAQSSPSSVIRGVVTDSMGAAVPNAKVTITGAETTVAVPVTTDGAGRYVVPLPPGTYTLSVEAAGFKRYAQDGIRLAAQQQATVDVALQVGFVVSAAARERAFQKLQGLLKASPNRPCAIPLTNVVPEGAPVVEPMKTFSPADPSRFPVQEVPPPAPSCDDVKR
jgi:hypothetical protein